MTIAGLLPAPPRLSALACIGRGIASLRANWELVLVTWVGTLVVVLLAVGAVVGPLVALGFPALRRAVEDPEAFARELPSLAVELPAIAGKLIAAALVISLLLGVVFLVYSWFQAGVFGVLTAADRQAPQQLRGAGDDWRLFRTFDLRHLAGWARRYTWRFFGFYHLLALVSLVPLVATILWMALLGLAGERWGAGASTGVGCGGLLPLLFLYLVTALWWLLGQADLAQDGSGVLAASRQALEVLGRRLGATLFLVLLFTLASVLVTVASMPVSLAAGLALEASSLAQRVVSAALLLLQMLASAVITIVFSASLVALMRSERRRAEVR